MATTQHPFDFRMHFPKPKIDGEPKGGENVSAKKPSSAKLIKSGRADEYEVLEEIGRGSYGTVYRAREKKTGEIVAMKKELNGFCRSSLREIDILQSLAGWPWFVEFKKVVLDEDGGVDVVMEYVENDLARVMDGMTRGFTEWEAKHVVRQLLEGVAFLHENGIMHRDLKPSNLLLRNDGRLKICDFGFSKRFERRFDRHSHNVGSRWYRAPELLVGEERYSCAIDMWSVGCIMAELLHKQVLFKGSSETDQLRRIAEIIGKQKRFLWPPFDRKFANVLSGKGIDLLKNLLTCDPDSRITADQALNHKWFTDI